MNKLKSLIFLLSISLITSIYAATPQLDNIDASDLEGVIKDFSANTIHNSVSPPSTLGNIFGLEVGVVGGITKTRNIEILSEEQQIGSKVDKAPHGALLIAASFPGAITAEVMLLPTIDLSDIEYKTFSFAGKWTFSEYLGAKGPAQVAFRFHVADATLSYTDEINNASTGNIPTTAQISLDNKIWGAHILLGLKLPIFEPYAGIGFAKTTGTLAVSGGATIFDQTFNTSSSAELSDSTGHLMLGVNMNLLLLKFGAEFTRAFGTTSLTGKVSFYF